MTLDIFIPFWGDSALLLAAVRSVRAQTVTDWRLTVVDDCSPGPDVEPMLREFGDYRIHYIRNERNLGVTENFQRCVQLAEAEYLCIPGYDDLLLPGYVKAALDAVIRFPSAGIIQLGVRVVDAAGAVTQSLPDVVKRALRPRSSERGMTLGGEDLATSLLRGDWLYWPSLVFRTASLRTVDFRPEFLIIQDLAILVDLALKDIVLAVVPDIQFSYRRHSASLSQRAILDGSRFHGERQYYRLAAKLMVERGWPRAARTARWRLISRLHAIAMFPLVMFRGTREGRKRALELAFAI